MLLIDTHNDITSRTVDGYDIGKNKNDGHTNITALKEGGVGAQFFAVYVASSYVKGNHSAHRTLEMIDTVRHGIVERYPNDFALATTADDIERIHKQGKIAALMGIEGGHAIEDNLGLLRDYYDLGIRYMTLTHTNTNDWADSSGDIDKPGVAASQRPHAFRQAGGARDEPAGNDDRHLAYRRQNVLGRAGNQPRADHRVAFFLPGAVQRSAQHDG